MNNHTPVSAILDGKNHKVWTVPPSMTVYEAIALMAQKNIGSLPVVSGGFVIGLFTERDYTRKIALLGRSSKQTLVAEIVSCEVSMVTPETTIEECMRLMTARRTRHLPVLQNGELVGIVSIGDLVNWTISCQAAAIEQMEQYIAGTHAAGVHA